MHGLVLALRAATVRIQSLSSLGLPNSFVLFRMKVFVHMAGNRVVGGGGVRVVGCVSWAGGALERIFISV